jgi:hypothetical protein
MYGELLDVQLNAELTHNDAWFAPFSGSKELKITEHRCGIERI